MLRIAHGKLPVFDEVVVLRDTLYLASFERERIISDQQRRVRLPLDPDMPATHKAKRISLNPPEGKVETTND